MTQDDLLVILNAIVEPVFLVDANRSITLANAAAVALFGQGLMGRDFVYAIRHPDALACMREVLAGRASADAVITLSAPVRATYRMSIVRLGPSDEIGTGAVVSLNNISHILEAEQMRSDFVANVSHELRSPLAALCGSIETLKGAAKDDPEGRAAFLDLMEREAARMNRLVADLLSLSSVEVHEQVPPTDYVDIASIVEKVIAALQTQSAMDRRPIVLQGRKGDWLVKGDEDEITQVIQNLIDNAVKYSCEASKVTVSLTRRDRVAGMKEPAVAVEVKDEGEGIPAEHVPRLTERFYRVDKGRSREKGGTGLGLAIVKHILNRHRGRLLIESRKGVGSTFTACLPLAEPRQRQLS